MAPVLQVQDVRRIKDIKNPRLQAQRDADVLRARQPSEGSRMLLRTKPRDKMDEVLALQARQTMHKWKRDGSGFRLNGGTGMLASAHARATDAHAAAGRRLLDGDDGSLQCNLKGILDNYPNAQKNSQAFAPPTRAKPGAEVEMGPKAKEDSKEDIVEAVSNLLMQLPAEALVESSSAISALARKLAGESGFDSAFSQKFLLMSQIQVEVQRRVKEARTYIEDFDNLHKEDLEEKVNGNNRRRQSSIANAARLMGSMPKHPSSQSEVVADQMRTIRRLLHSLNWPNLHQEFQKWVRNATGYESGVRDFLRAVEEDCEKADIDQVRDDVCTSLTNHELRLTKSLRSYQLQMQTAARDFTSGANGDSSPRSPADEKKRKLDRALERKTNAKQAEIRRISMRRQFSSNFPPHSRSQQGSRRSSRLSLVSAISAAPSAQESSQSQRSSRETQGDASPLSNSMASFGDELAEGGEFDINNYDDGRFGHLKRIYLSHETKIQALREDLDQDSLQLEKVIEELREQVKRLIELQALYEMKTKSSLRRGSLFIPRRRALMLNQGEADANSVTVLAKRIVNLQKERASLLDSIKELGKSMMQDKPRRGAIMNKMWEAVKASTAEGSFDVAHGDEYMRMLDEGADRKEIEEKMRQNGVEDPSELLEKLEANEEEEEVKGGKLMQRIQRLESELEEIKEKLAALVAQVNQMAVPRSLGKVVAFEMQPKMRLCLHSIAACPEIDVMVKKALEFLDLPKMQIAPSRKQLQDTLDIAQETFDSEVAERKSSQETGTFSAKWEQEVQQCMALLSEQLFRSHAELLQDRRPPLKEITAPEDGPGASPAASQRPGSQAASNITQAERRSSFSTLTDVQAKLETGGIREPEAQLGVTQTNSIAGESGHADEVRAHSSQEDSARSGDADAGMATAGEAPNAEARAEQARLQAQAAQAEQILQVQADVESADKEIEQLMEALRKAKEAKEAEAKEVEPKEPEELPELEPSPQSSSHFQRIVSGSSAGTSDAHSPRRHSGLLDDSQDADHTMMSYIKAEGRKKKRMLQMRNVKFKLLQKLLEQAGLIKDLHLQNGEPETDEERGKRLQQDLKAAHERNRRLSQQLDFWGTRIDQRKDQLDEEKKHLRKEFGRNWESKLERALLGTEEDPESEATSETSESEEENNTHGERGTAGQQPESKQPGEESVRLVPGKRNQVVGKTYSKERPRVRRRAPDEREHPREPREELPGTLQRKPLASFGAARGEDMEDVVLQGRRQSYSSRRSSQTSDDSNSRVSEDLDPHDRGSLADHIVKVMGNAPKSQSYLEGLNRLRPSAQYYTYGKRREVPGQKKRSKRRVSIRSFVEDLSDDGTDRERRRPSTASLLPEGFDARGRTLRGNSRLSRASVESRSAFSDGDQGELQQLVQEAAEEEHKGVNAAEWLQKALALRQESRKRSKGSTLAAPVHLETVRLLRTAAKMSMKRQVAADDLLGANLLRAQHMNVTSAGQKSKQIFQADAAFREMAERRKVEAEAWTQRLASGTARSRYAATKAKLLAMEGLETRRPPLPKKEALRRLFRAKTTSPAQSEGFIRSRGRSQAKSRSKQVLDNFENALGKARNSDAHREIARMKVMSLHHSAMRRRFLQNYSSEEEEEDEVVHRRSIMMLAEDESPNRPGRKGLIGASPERAVSKPLQGLTTALNEGVQDEKVAEVAAKWLGERPYDDRESMIVDASAHVEQTEAPALASFGAFRPSRRMKARTMGPRSQSRRRSEEGSSSGSEDSYPSTSRRTDRSNASPDGDENVHFRNVAYFIDLMNENDSHKHRKRKSSRRRRKALRQQRMQASRADVRWHSHMLKLLELRLGTSRPQASGHVSDESPSDCDSSRSPARRHGPPPLPRKLAARARTAPNTQVEAPRAESPKPPAKTGGTENSSLKTMARDDGLRQSERTQACPKSVQMKLEEGGWSRLKSPALPQAQDAHRPLQGTQPSPWWGRRHDTRQARFAASTARVNFNDTDADAKERDRQLRAQKWVQVGAQMGTNLRWRQACSR
ncbi:unnamed protein product [Effrenium voratum]|uniref:Uncharacterized protein n=1 Tax=Effrenium voratum TaxID=2562239 RepID=A0AA36I8K6_9DINO|nr:unnamed protein product [Effrenium voratum]